MNTKVISGGAQFVTFVLSLFSGYLEAVAPISDDSLRIVPGGIASLVALILLLLAWAVGKTVPPGKKRRIFWLALAVAVAGLAVWSILRYADLWQRWTAEVPVSFADDGEAMYGRRVKGTVFTDRAEAFIEKQRIDNPDDRALIQAFGGIAKVWTEQSIKDQWWELSRAYVLSVAATVLALSFLAQLLAPTRGTAVSRLGARRGRG